MSDFTYLERDSKNRLQLVIDEAAIAYNCETEEETYLAAIEHLDAVREEVILKWENLTGEVYFDG